MAELPDAPPRPGPLARGRSHSEPAPCDDEREQPASPMRSESARRSAEVIVPLDARSMMDRTMELAFVLAAKTLLSEERSRELLPLRMDHVFERYMQPAAQVLLGACELDFLQSSRNLRQFARAMEQQGFVSLDMSGMEITDICYRMLDDVYPDSTIFSFFVDDDADDEYLDEQEREFLDMCERKEFEQDAAEEAVSDAEGCAAEELLMDVPPSRPLPGQAAAAADGGFSQKQRASTRRAAGGASEDPIERTKQKQTHKLLLRNLFLEKDAIKKEHAQLKDEKQLRKVVEKKLRDVKGFSGNSGSGRRKDNLKYNETMALLQDPGYIRHTLESNLKSLEKRLPKYMKMIADLYGVGRIAPKSQAALKGSDPSAAGRPHPAASPAVAGRRDDPAASRPVAGRHDDPGRCGERRQEERGQRGRARGDAPPRAAEGGAPLRVRREQRAALALMGFPQCSRDVASLPAFADLRRGYKKAALALHPDKSAELDGARAADAAAARAAGGEPEHRKADAAGMDFQAFQHVYEGLLGAFYDAKAGGFSEAAQARRRHAEKLQRTSRAARRLEKEKKERR